VLISSASQSLTTYPPRDLKMIGSADHLPCPPAPQIFPARILTYISIVQKVLECHGAKAKLTSAPTKLCCGGKAFQTQEGHLVKKIVEYEFTDLFGATALAPFLQLRRTMLQLGDFEANNVCNYCGWKRDQCRRLETKEAE
jgi:hypothetical protein